jgi:hypothetical protein
VNDPAGNGSRQSLSSLLDGYVAEGYAAGFITRGSIYDPVDLSTLSITLVGPAELIVTSPSSEETGVDSSGQQVTEIPESAYFEDAVDDDTFPFERADPEALTRSVNILNPASGVYRITVRATEPARFPSCSPFVGMAAWIFTKSVTTAIVSMKMDARPPARPRTNHRSLPAKT